MTQESVFDANRGYRRILVAVDFSASAGAALNQAICLARKTGAAVTLTHALPSFRHAVQSASYLAKTDLLYGEGSVFHVEARKESDEKMRKMIADLDATDLDVKVETLIGAPYVEITHAVQKEGYDLVLAGTRGLAAWEQFFVGSTAKRLIRNCPSSVWITNQDHAAPIKSVLATTDFSEVSRRAVLQGLWVAQQMSAQFHLLHVIESMDVPEEIIFTDRNPGALRREINQQATLHLNTFVESLNVDSDVVQQHLTWGTPWEEIGRLAKHLNADLLAMGTVGRSGVNAALLGNTAEKVLDTCDCSLLTVKPADYVSPIMPAFWSLHPSENLGDLDSKAKQA